MVIDKILNNNVVISKNAANEEIIYMGCGLAFKKKIGDSIDPMRIYFKRFCNCQTVSTTLC